MRTSKTKLNQKIMLFEREKYQTKKSDPSFLQAI